jgi:hypothetical protein
VRSFPTLLGLAAAVALIASGCGSSGGSGSSGGQKTTSLVTDVSHATAGVKGKEVVASVQVKEGGHAGEHLSLRWGLVDAVSGVRSSEQEELAASYVTTSTVKTATATIHVKLPTPTDYLVHFALYAPDGSYLASADSQVFTVPG